MLIFHYHTQLIAVLFYLDRNFDSQLVNILKSVLFSIEMNQKLSCWIFRIS